MKNYKNNRRLVEVTCDQCGKSYEKPVSEYNRNLKLNRRNFCSRVCVGKASNKHLRLGTPYDISKHANNRGSSKSPFKYLLRTARQRFKEFSIDISDIEEVWKKQQGRCIYSGVDLHIPRYKERGNDKRFTASLDRIDSSKGYVVGNIQLISISMNYMKSTMSHKETVELCNIISSFLKEN